MITSAKLSIPHAALSNFYVKLEIFNILYARRWQQ